MKLNEVQPKSIINVTVSKENSSINLTTTVIGYDWEKEALIVEPFMYEENMVSFAVPDISVEMMVVIEGEAPFYWKAVSVATFKADGKYYHAILSDLVGVRLNRRNSFRVFVGEEGTVIQTTGSTKHPALIKDISATGIGIILQGDTEPIYSPGAQVHINYMDNEARFGIDVIGRVVRAKVMEKGVLYGCSFSKVYPQINKYVTQKQIKNRQKKKKEQLMNR